MRPNSVSIGSTDRQALFSPQSPQPSQTRSLMWMRCGGVGRLAALAQAAALGRALLVVDEDRDALDLGELGLRVRELVAVHQPGDRVELDALVALGLLGGDDDLLDALEAPASA